MNSIDLTNCCYPPEKARNYEVHYEHTLQGGLQLAGNIRVKVNPGQNVEMEVDKYLAQTNTIYYSNYTLIKQL